MSIRRISELPDISQFYKDNGEEVKLSDCIMEASFSPDDGITYKSGYITGTNFTDRVIKEMSVRPIEKISITESLKLKDSVLCVEHSTMELLSGSSFIAWPNDDPNGGSTALCAHFTDIVLSADKTLKIVSNDKLDLKGNPVVINDNLYVYANQTKTDNVVEFTNTNNIINAQPVSTTLASLQANPNRVVTCGMLQTTLADIAETIYQLDRGSGIRYNPPQIRYNIEVKSNNEEYGTVTGGGEKISGQSVSLYAIAKEGHVFNGWNGGQTSKNNPLTFTADKNYQITAYFDDDPALYKITVVEYSINSTTGKVSFTTNPTGVSISPNPETFKPEANSENTFYFSKTGYQTISKIYFIQYKEQSGKITKIDSGTLSTTKAKNIATKWVEDNGGHLEKDSSGEIKLDYDLTTKTYWFFWNDGTSSWSITEV